MTREQQKKLKVLEASFMKLAQPYIKKYKLKKKDFMLWAERDGLFFSLFADVSVNPTDGKCYCTERVTVKPLWADDTFWEIMGMETNKQEPLSLRSIGAFTVYGAMVSDKKYELPEWELEAMEPVVEKIIEDFKRYVDSIQLDDFYQLAEKTKYKYEVTKCIILIYQERYVEAMELLNSAENGLYFANEGRYFRERGMDYIKDKMMPEGHVSQ